MVLFMSVVFQEIFQHGMTMLSENRFWVKLNAFNGQTFVANTHDFAIIGAGVMPADAAARDVLAAQDTLTFVQAQKTAVSEQLASAKRNFEVGTATITDTRESQARFDLAFDQGADDRNLKAKFGGLLRSTDKVVFNSYEALHIAKAEARALAEAGYRPPLPARRIQVAGDVGIATFKMMLVNMLEGRFISPYDYEIAERIATVLCGGKVDRGTLVDEEWLLTLERKHFVELAQQEKTQARIAHMLKTGKPLRN